jgi:hypothetical protein
MAIPSTAGAIEERPLSEFLEDHAAHLQRLRETQEPEVLTVEGEPRLVVQDAKAYRDLLERVDLLETVSILQGELDAIRRGVPGIPAEQVFKELREMLGISEAGAADEV